MVIKQPFNYSPKNQNRTLHIYLPNDYDASAERYPVMYFFDGHNLFRDSDATYSKCWGLEAFLDGWQKKMIVVGMECGHEGRERLDEYCPYDVRGGSLGEIHGMGEKTMEWIVHEVKPWEPFETQGYTFYPLRANHRPRAVEDCLIYAISDGERAILYANDTGEVADEVIEYLKTTGLRFSVVSMDCARGLLPGDGHMGWNEALALRERLEEFGLVAGDARYILNHLSHMNDMTHSEWERFAAPHGIEVAWDGMRVCC